MLPKCAAKGYQYLTDSDLTEVLIEIVKRMDAKVEDIPTALEYLDGISKARANRNLVSHFAGKRFPDEDRLRVSRQKRARRAERLGPRSRW
jgi:hypothetical protein